MNKGLVANSDTDTSPLQSPTTDCFIHGTRTSRTLGLRTTRLSSSKYTRSRSALAILNGNESDELELHAISMEEWKVPRIRSSGKVKTPPSQMHKSTKIAPKLGLDKPISIPNLGTRRIITPPTPSLQPFYRSESERVLSSSQAMDVDPPSVRAGRTSMYSLQPSRPLTRRSLSYQYDWQPLAPRPHRPSSPSCYSRSSSSSSIKLPRTPGGSSDDEMELCTTSEEESDKKGLLQPPPSPRFIPVVQLVENVGTVDVDTDQEMASYGNLMTIGMPSIRISRPVTIRMPSF